MGYRQGRIIFIIWFAIILAACGNENSLTSRLTGGTGNGHKNQHVPGQRDHPGGRNTRISCTIQRYRRYTLFYRYVQSGPWQNLENGDRSQIKYHRSVMCAAY